MINDNLHESSDVLASPSNQSTRPLVLNLFVSRDPFNCIIHSTCPLGMDLFHNIISKHHRTHPPTEHVAPESALALGTFT